MPFAFKQKSYAGYPRSARRYVRKPVYTRSKASRRSRYRGLRKRRVYRKSYRSTRSYRRVSYRGRGRRF